MKKLIYFVIMLLVSNCNYLYSQSGWMQQTSGVSVTLNKIFFVNSQTGWAVGDLGKIIRTTNGGANWVSQISNTNEILRSVYFINDNTGWAVGGKYNYKTFSQVIILKTTNKGNTWVVKYSSPDFYNTLYSIWFI
ncbi:MAG: hypothetical protein LH629_04770, partial [Ignavibacteria bacterium]|nr:hypothetical protein [Ignavibacteria bacterium]